MKKVKSDGMNMLLDDILNSDDGVQVVSVKTFEDMLLDFEFNVKNCDNWIPYNAFKSRMYRQGFYDAVNIMLNGGRGLTGLSDILKHIKREEDGQ